MDDIRFIWLREKVFSALDISEPDVFDEFMLRDEGENELKIAKFLNQTEEDDDYALIFHKEVREEETEIKIELSEEEYMAIVGKETIDDVEVNENGKIRLEN